MAGYIEQLRSYRPDLVTLEETAPWDLRPVPVSGVFDDLPYRFSVPWTIEDPEDSSSPVAIRWDMRRCSMFTGLAYMIRFSLSFHGRRLPLWVVHTTPPINPDWNNWNLELNGVYSELEKFHPRPAVDGRRLQCLLGQSRLPGHPVDRPDGCGGGARAAL